MTEIDDSPAGYVTRYDLNEVAQGRIGGHVYPAGTLRPENEIPLYIRPAPSTPPVADDVSGSGEFVLNRRGPDFAFPMEDAPKDGSILRLLVKFDRKSAAGAFEDTTEPSWTIGTNNKANTGEDQWDIVGWSWEQDVFCHAYGATAIGWLPFHTESSEPAALPPPAASPSPQHIGDAGGVEQILDAVMASERQAPKVVSMGANPPLFDGMQPDPDGAWVSRVDVAKRLRAALPPARVEAGEAGWLIECKPSVSRTPQWFHLEEEWVTDASKALRFSRKQDAEAFIEHTGWTEAFASEHMWSDPK